MRLVERDVTDDTGAPLLHFEQGAWHCLRLLPANQKAVSYESDTGPPTVKDRLPGFRSRPRKIRVRNIRRSKGLPWNYVGTDPAIAAQRLQEDKDKALAKESTLVGQKLSLGSR